MAVVPCSMRTLAAIAHGLGDNLMHRAADVVLKERRKLLLAPREAPLSDIHLENMLKLSRMGTVICPPMPGFYQRPETVADIVNQSVVRMLDQFGVHLDSPGRWGEAYELGWPEKLPAEDSDDTEPCGVDLNADIGESFGMYQTGNDEMLMRSITSGSIACGFHAGDPSRDAADRTGTRRERVWRLAHTRLPGSGRLWPARDQRGPSGNL